MVFRLVSFIFGVLEALATQQIAANGQFTKAPPAVLLEPLLPAKANDQT